MRAKKVRNLFCTRCSRFASVDFPALHVPATLDIIQSACSVDHDALSLASVPAKPTAAAAAAAKDVKESVSSPKKALSEALKKAADTPKTAETPKSPAAKPQQAQPQQSTPKQGKKASKGKGK